MSDSPSWLKDIPTPKPVIDVSKDKWSSDYQLNVGDLPDNLDSVQAQVVNEKVKGSFESKVFPERIDLWTAGTPEKKFHSDVLLRMVNTFKNGPVARNGAGEWVSQSIFKGVEFVRVGDEQSPSKVFLRKIQ